MNIICGITSKNHFAKVRVLADSIRRHEPDTRFVALLVDRFENDIDPAQEPFEIMTIEELDNIPRLGEMILKYNVLELNTAAKPFFIETMFRKFGADKVCYLDADVMLFSDLSEIWSILERASFIITPHITEPYQDDKHPTEIEINRAGIFNLGFIALSRGETSFKFLEWWKDRLSKFCFVDMENGLFVDQLWINFAPSFYEDVFILRDKAYNVAYWNLHERADSLVYDQKRLLIGGKPVGFFHFSGFNPLNNDVISIYQDRFMFEDIPNLRGLFDLYAEQLSSHGLEETSKWRYAFERFDNGVNIPSIAHLIYAEWNGADPDRFNEPLSTKAGSFYAELNSIPDEGLTPLTKLHLYIYQGRIDLRETYPDLKGADRSAFIKWLLMHGRTEYRIPFEMLPTFSKFDIGGRVTFGKPNWMSLNTIRMAYKKILKTDPRLRGRSKQPRIETALPFGVNVLGYFTATFGIAEAANTSLRALKAANIPFAVNNFTIHDKRIIERPDLKIIKENPYRFNLIQVNADQTPELLMYKPAAYFKDRYNIGLWFWELENFPQAWRAYFSVYQEIWTVSSFCQRSISAASKIPVVKMVMPVEVSDPDPRFGKDHFGIRDDIFTFGFTFDHHSFQQRKNPLAVMNAFKLAFGDRKDVQLVIKSMNADSARQQASLLEREAKGFNIKIIDSIMSKDEMQGLMWGLDCYVSLHRSEGFGIELARSMARGKPVIATGYSGNMEFMDQNNSYLARYDLTEVERDHGPYKKGEHWAEPDVEHAASLMLRVVGDVAETSRISARAKKDMREKFSAEVAGEKMMERLLLLSD